VVPVDDAGEATARFRPDRQPDQLRAGQRLQTAASEGQRPKLKDGLLNDCLADALVYQGESRQSIRRALVDTLSKVLAGMETAAPLVLISDSLGSKLVFERSATCWRMDRPAPQSWSSYADP
jgi:hypothetical protein